MSRKVYNSYKIKDNNQRIFTWEIEADNIDEAIEKLARYEGMEDLNFVYTGDKENDEFRKILLRGIESEWFAVEFSHDLKDKEQTDEDKMEIEKVRSLFAKITWVEKDGTEDDDGSYGLEFYNEYNSEYIFGYNKTDMIGINQGNIVKVIKTHLKNMEIKRMIVKYNGLYLNDEWIEVDLTQSIRKE